MSEAAKQATRAQAKLPGLVTDREKNAAARAIAGFDSTQIGKYAEGQGMAELTKGEQAARQRMLDGDKKREEAWNSAISMIQKARANSKNPIDAADAGFYALGVALSNMHSVMWRGAVNGLLRGGHKATHAEKALKARTDMKAAQARVDVGGRPYGWSPLPKSLEMRVFYGRRDSLNRKLSKYGKAQVMSMSPTEPATMLMGAALNASDRMLAGEDPATVYEDFRRAKVNITAAAREFGHDAVDVQDTYVDMVCDSLRCDESGKFDSQGNYIRVGRTVSDGKVGYRVVGYDDFRTVVSSLCNNRDASLMNLSDIRTLSGAGDGAYVGLHDMATAMRAFDSSAKREKKQMASLVADEAAVVDSEYTTSDLVTKVSHYLDEVNKGEIDMSDSVQVGRNAAVVFANEIADIRSKARGFEQADVDNLARMHIEIGNGFQEAVDGVDSADYGLFKDLHDEAARVYATLPDDVAKEAFLEAMAEGANGVAQDAVGMNSVGDHALDFTALKSVLDVGQLTSDFKRSMGLDVDETGVASRALERLLVEDEGEVGSDAKQNGDDGLSLG